MNKFLLKLKTFFLSCRENGYKARITNWRFLFWALVVLVTLKLLVVPVFILFPDSMFFAELNKTIILGLINQEREKQNLAPLEESPVLNKTASLKAQHMMAFDYFSHESPQGVDPWHWFRKAGYDYQAAGENLAVGFLDSEEVYKAWADSESHYQNMVSSKYTQTGLAIIRGEFQGRETSLLVQTFGKPKEVKAAPEPEKEMLPEEQQKEATATEAEEKTVAGQTQVKEEETAQGPLAEEKDKELKSLYTMKMESGTSFNLLKFMVSGYSSFIQKAIFFTLLVIIASIAANLFFVLISEKKKLFFKLAFLSLFLFVLCYADKDILVQLLPHNLMI